MCSLVPRSAPYDHVPPTSPYFFIQPYSLGSFHFRTSFSFLRLYLNHYCGLCVCVSLTNSYAEAQIPKYDEVRALRVGSVQEEQQRN